MVWNGVITIYIGLYLDVKQENGWIEEENVFSTKM
jgi:hypothetical protein